MADITMCENEACPIKRKCYRYTAIESSYQYYSLFKPTVDNGSVRCHAFWDNKERSEE